MSYNTCTALFSNFTSISSMTECLKNGNAFAVLGNHKKLFIEKGKKISESELEFYNTSDRGDIKLYFLRNDYQKLQTVFQNLCEVYTIKPVFNSNVNFSHKKKRHMGDIILGIFLGICVYDIAQDLVLLKNNTDGSNKASIEILKHYYDEEQTDSDFFINKIQDIYSKRAKNLTEAFLKIKEVCDYFCIFTKSYPNITEKYNTAFYNILVGTYFHGDCKYLNPYATASDTSQKPKRIKVKSEKKLKVVEFFKNQSHVYLDLSFDQLDPETMKMLFPTQENFTETFEDEPSIDKIQNEEEFADIRRIMKDLFIVAVDLYGFENVQNRYKFNKLNNIWNETDEIKNKYLKLLPEMIKSLLFFNQDEATKFTNYLETLKDDLQDHDSYKNLVAEIHTILGG